MRHPVGENGQSVADPGFPVQGVQPYILPIFWEKTLKSRKIWPGGGDAFGVPPAPPARDPPLNVAIISSRGAYSSTSIS